MRHDPSLWQLALESLDANHPVGLLYVVDSQGSSPGRAGFALCLTAERAAGSIGGGAMEFRFITEVRQALAQGAAAFLRRQVHDPDADDDRSGMICSGEQTFWFQPLNQGDRWAVEAILTAITNRLGGVLTLGPAGLEFDPMASRPVRHRYRPGTPWSYEEDLGRRDRLHIIGGGHCGLALSQLAAGLDFEVFVYDDRAELPTFVGNTWAHHKILVPDYTVMDSFVADGEDQYVCVMTFGYKTDDVVLRAIMGRRYRFLGALGSRSKIDKMFAAYAAEGVPEDQLRRIQAPLGLPIHSQTPAEIAVSIAAQLIRVRNEPTSRSLA